MFRIIWVGTPRKGPPNVLARDSFPMHATASRTGEIGVARTPYFNVFKMVHIQQVWFVVWAMEEFLGKKPFMQKN